MYMLQVYAKISSQIPGIVKMLGVKFSTYITFIPHINLQRKLTLSLKLLSSKHCQFINVSDYTLTNLTEHHAHFMTALKKCFFILIPVQWKTIKSD